MAPAGKLLAPMVPAQVPLLRCGKDMVATDLEAALLLRMSAATIDLRHPEYPQHFKAPDHVPWIARALFSSLVRLLRYRNHCV